MVRVGVNPMLKNDMLSVPERTLESRNFLKFRCRMDSEIGSDVHRRFSGVYYPRWRSIYLDEIREITGRIKLFPVFELAVMHKPDGDYFFPTDFVEGARLNFGRSEFSRDDDAKTFIITEVDASALQGWQLSTAAQQSSPVASAPPLVVRLREQLAARSGSVPQAVKDFGKRFRVPAANGQRVVDRDGFEALCADVQLAVSRRDIDDFFGHFEADADGNIKFEDVMTCLRGPMSQERKHLVADAFARIDTDRDGVVHLHELQAAYKARNHPDAVSGAVTEAQVLNGFMSSWDSREKNGRITFPEFADFYSGLSAVIDDDRVFARIVQRAWMA
jgi:Ca2+-binding EF-hand superfamily protein